MSELVGNVERLQAAMAQMPQVQLETSHFFADGMYCRMLPRPAFTLIVGKVHRREHLYIVCCGTVRVFSGDESRDITGPAVIVSAPGTKRAVFALTDATCLTMHRTNSRDLDEIERELTQTDETALFDSRNELKFDVPAFRELTKKIIAHEKAGFWSEWTDEQQRLYKAGEWQAFSESRGYSADEIADYQKWLNMVKDGLNKGINPHSFTIDITTRAALANIARAGSIEEILKSSHAPFESRDDL